MTPGPSRRVLARYGRRGDQVKVLVEVTRARVEVHYRAATGEKRMRTFPDDRAGRKEAIAFAEAYLEERTRLADVRAAPYDPITVRALWDAFRLAEFHNLRSKTQQAYAERWARWETFLTRGAIADDTTLDHVDRFRAAASAQGYALNQIRQVLNVARLVFAWGQMRKKIRTNEMALFRWKQPKDAPTIQPEEYSAGELERILRVFDPTQHDQWRPWVALMLLIGSGQRANAILHLGWSDLDESWSEITWTAAFQKQGKELRRPVTDTIRSGLIVADLWRRRAGFVAELDTALRVPVKTPWVLFALNKKDQPYSYSSLYAQLRKGEAKAGVEHRAYRAFHGGRRMVVGEISERTGDRMLGLDYVGDIDPKMLKVYDKRIAGRVEKAARALEEQR